MSNAEGLLDLAAGFRQYFEILPTLDQSASEVAYGIRHDVYCRDLGYEPVRDDGLETDEYDRHSLHCLLRTSGVEKAPVGCVRIVLARPEEPEFPLPFERTCAATLDRSIIDPARLPRDKITEVSRLAVVGRFRRRKGEENAPVTIGEQDFGSVLRPRFPFIPVGLYLGSIALSLHHGIEHLFMLTEPRLAHHFMKIGFVIEQIGGPVEHRGTRVPSLLRAVETVEGLKSNLRGMYDVIETSIRAAYANRPAEIC
ncbi:MAG: PEP-CTERM/exosortase system-associated acyltransferase [Zoogloeaceae bacterium]|nr:PEP-CTERM/exosortase system-associated acyltransferase [Zoogloeaceae bacterium]